MLSFMLKTFVASRRGAALAVLLMVMGPGSRTAAQVPLFLTNEATTVRRITFEFTDTRTFEDDVLRPQIATKAPGFWDKVNVLSSKRYPLDRIELQKDVVRLRRFYQQNGFLFPRIDYGTSRLDTTQNTIRVIFEIDEGEPLIIQDVGFFSPQGGFATSLFTGEMRDRWIDFRDRTSFKTGDRFTRFDLVRIQDQVLSWLKDRGYAFARLDTDVAIDSTYHTADIRFNVDPGPLGYFDRIEVEGHTRVTEDVVRRELPFKQGEVFSNSKLIQGQRELFGLNLFRVALVDVPPQPRDSTVEVRLTVREAKLHFITAQTGYSEDDGVTLVGQWSHRNFLGGARSLTASAVANTGYLSNPPVGIPTRRLFRGSVALRQPYLFSNHLSGIIEPFIQFERDPLLLESDRTLGINRQEIGVNTTLFYEILPFRTLSLQYRLSRAGTFTDERAGTDQARDTYSLSILTLNATFGRVNNFLNPRRGFLIRPFAEYAGGLFEDVEYVKAGAEVVAYIPVTRVIRLGTRLSMGRLWPLGQSRRQFVAPFEDRFDPIRFYTGGPNDVRGWDFRLLGPKENRTQAVVKDGTPDLGDDGLPKTQDERFEPVGGLAMLTGNVEARLRFPWLSPAWRLAVFLDFGQVSAVPEDNCPGTAMPSENTQCGFRDDGTLRLDGFKFGLGAGIRYETPIGYIRVDLAYKLNPDDLDLQTPRNAFLFEENYLAASRRQPLRRFNLHLSLGQAF
ncbi:MAG: outer membrane protein assembly factor [Rhodothermales bacterium]